MPYSVCHDCSFKFAPAKSKRVVECPNCKCYERTGEYLTDKAKRKGQESLIASKARAKAKRALKPQKRATLPKFSTSGAKQAREVAKTKREAKEAALDGGFVECEGCGKFCDTIDYSHTISLAQSSALASARVNGRLFCRCCHDIWENGTVAQMIELNCFLEDMHYLLDMDPERFHKRHNRLLDEYNLRPTPKLGRTLSKIEQFDL